MLELWRDDELVACYRVTSDMLRVSNGKVCIVMPPGYVEIVTGDELRFDPTEIIAAIARWMQKKPD
jgi:hypothetical protein